MQKKIDISSLIKACDVFERFRIDMHNDRDKAGAIQAFEFCYELSWKMMKRFLEARGVEASSPKTIFRSAVLEKFIEDPEIWFEFQKKRNLTSHIYEQKVADEIIEIFDLFSKELKKLINKLQEET
ncbi:HI0074 family nucleotidyltransferase substrate-binding subunit [Rickettsia endosymbiont of Polydrusus tereticollis]|uniref:HI0074 family nucleotidyltransferase substrate-binding subunit n=1 Tax=Rickettsia endosymbiont of Polydrusus tereticollis TaxID=3066251 RepID=UPI00313323DB